MTGRVRRDEIWFLIKNVFVTVIKKTKREGKRELKIKKIMCV